ncbi:MAG: NUDIX hydrolase [Hyphomicrobiaceae bacterium]
MSEQAVIERPTARVVVLDPSNRILLFRAMIGHSVEPERLPDAVSFWALPGGGIEAGETAQAAACRELREETGLMVQGILPLVAHRTTAYDWKGRRYLTREHFFFHRSTNSALDSSGWLEADKRWMCDLGWWTLDALQSTNEIVRPPGLAELALALSQGRLPDKPILLARPR